MDYTGLATDELINRTIAAAAERGITAEFMPDRTAALDKVTDLIPADASVMTGASPDPGRDRLRSTS